MLSICETRKPLLPEHGSYIQIDDKESVNSLPIYKILDWSKLKAFADDKITVLKKMIFVLDRVENIVGNIAGSPFSIMFSKDFLPIVVKSLDCVVKS